MGLSKTVEICSTEGKGKGEFDQCKTKYIAYFGCVVGLKRMNY